MLDEYTKSVEHKMRTKHDAKVRIIVKSGREILEDDLTDMENFGGAMTRISYMYNRAALSGGISWWNPATGKAIKKPRITAFVRPQDVLTGDQECDCDDCTREVK